MLGIKQRPETQFNEVATVFISETKTNHANSMSLLKQNGLRPMTYQEALVLIYRNPELMAQLNGRWFYLGGKGLKESGYYTSNNEGKLTEGKGDIEKTVHVYPGDNPLLLLIHSDHLARTAESRFDLHADDDPHYVASVVVGVKIGCEVATLKI